MTNETKELIDDLRSESCESYYNADMGFFVVAADALEQLRSRNEELEQQNRELGAQIQLIDNIIRDGNKTCGDSVTEINSLLGRSPVKSLQLLTEQERKRAYVVGFTDASDWCGAEMSLQFITDEAYQQYAKRKGGDA